MVRRALAFILAAALLVTAGCAAPPTEAQPPGTATVVSIIDGDTVVIDLDGSRERVRLLGIDTPETDHPTRPVECYGQEATQRISELIPPGTEIRLERDVEGRDHFGRLLLYLYRAGDDLFVNETMVAEGFAATLHIDPNGAHRVALAAAERDARSRRAGLWAACGGPDVPLDPLDSR